MNPNLSSSSSFRQELHLLLFLLACLESLLTPSKLPLILQILYQLLLNLGLIVQVRDNWYSEPFDLGRIRAAARIFTTSAEPA